MDDPETLIGILDDAGAHLVRTLGEDGKRPRDKRWNRHRPSIDAVVDHLSDEGRLGIIPGSLDATVYDDDRGDRGSQCAVAHQLGAVRTLPTPRGRHYIVPGISTDRVWSQGRAGGEVKCMGFVLMHAGGLFEWAGYALAQFNTKPGGYDLDEWMGCATRAHAPTYRPPSVGAGTAKVRNSDPKLAREGNRNESLFEMLRLHPDVMFKAHRFASWETWHAHVEHIGGDVLASFPSRCPHETSTKVASTVHSVASWYWDKRTGTQTWPRRTYDHSPAYQAARGRRSGQVRRDSSRGQDKKIREMRKTGATYREIGHALKIDHKTAWNVINR